MRSTLQLMEDASTAEISRAQLWQWIPIETHDGRTVDIALVESLIAAELEKQGPRWTLFATAYVKGGRLMREMVRAPPIHRVPYGTAYQRVLKEENLGAD